MKTIIRVFLSVCFLSVFTLACKKNNNTSSKNLLLLQHKWMVVSVNGEALRYVGSSEDYYNFSTDNFLYTYVNKNYDTANYRLISDGRTLLLYHVVNKLKSNTPTTFNIIALANSQLILSNHNGILFALDSLKR